MKIYVSTGNRTSDPLLSNLTLKPIGYFAGPCKVQNETETKRNETKQIETKRNKSKPNESDWNETNRNETNQNETKQIETKRNK